MSSMKRSTLYNLAGAIVPTFATILVVPLYLETIGNARFGVLSLLWIIFGYFGLFDFGLSRATANRLAQLKDSDPAQRRSVFYTSLAANLIFGVFGAYILHLFMIPIFSSTSGINAELTSEIIAASGWIVAMFPLGMLNGVFVGSLEAKEKFLLINLQQTVGGLLIQCLPFVCVKLLGVSLENAVIGTFIARLFSTVWAGLSSMRDAGFIRRGDLSINLLGPLLKYGAWITLTNGISPLLVSVDQFLIAYKMGAQAVPYYSVPFGMVMKSLIVPNAISRSLFPRMSYGTAADAAEVTHDAIVATGSMMCLICAPALMISNIALSIWIGSDFAHSANSVAQLLLIGTWINAVAIIPFACLQAQGRPDLVAKFHALEVLPFIAILWICITAFGLPGAALAWCLRVSVDTYLLLRFTTGAKRAVSSLRPSILIMAAAYITSLLFRDNTLISVSLAVIYFLLSAWFLVTKYRELFSGLFLRSMNFARRIRKRWALE